MEALAIILLFFIAFFAICSILANRILRSAIAFCGALFITLQIASLYFTQTFIGYQFYVHANVNAINGFSQLFIWHILAAISFFAVLFFAFYKSNCIKTNKILAVLCASAALLTIATNEKFIKDSRSLIIIFNNDVTSFQKSLNKNNMSNYTLARHLVCKNRTERNVIVISLESYEKSLLEAERFASLTPNLRRIKNQWNYFPLQPNDGAWWTSGSIYTSLTGFPAFFGVHHNQIFKSSYQTEIVSLPQIFKQTNHKTMYLIGNAEHSGLEDMFKTLGVDSIIDDRSFPKGVYPESNYGLHDYDLFEIAKQKIKQFAQANQSFALFITTTDTHFPNGLYDERMEKHIKRDKEMSDLEFMIAAVDDIVSNFVEYLQNNHLLENTTVFIFPDHLKMGDPTMFNSCQRGLFLLTNANAETLKIDHTKPLRQIDLQKVILNGADIEHNAKFLTDFIGNDTNYIETHIEQLTSININGLLRSDTTRIPKEFRK